MFKKSSSGGKRTKAGKKLKSGKEGKNASPEENKEAARERMATLRGQETDPLPFDIRHPRAHSR